MNPRNENMTITDPGSDSCVSCNSIPGVTRLPCESPNVQAWSCSECGTEWAVTVVNPRPDAFLRKLAEQVAERKLWQQVDTLLAEVPKLTNGQLQARLIMLLAALDQHARTWPG